MAEFPFLIAPEDPDAAQELSGILHSQNGHFRQLLNTHGALLFRGFKAKDASDFECIATAATPDLVAYTGGGSPRKPVKGNVYNSTEYPAGLHIPLHCELSYLPKLPEHIWFFCETAPAEGGQTPIGHMKTLLEALDPDVVARFRDRGVRYIYNLHGGKGFGRGWQDAFLTDDRSTVSAWLTAQQCAYTWNDDDSLHATLHAPGTRFEAETGDEIWGNQAANWHVDGLPPAMAKQIRRLYADEMRFPKHATYGDGTPIAVEDIRHILNTQRALEVSFDWQQGDILWCDNRIVAHGRRAFEGARSILVALA